MKNVLFAPSAPSAEFPLLPVLVATAVAGASLLYILPGGNDDLPSGNDDLLGGNNDLLGGDDDSEVMAKAEGPLSEATEVDAEKAAFLFLSAPRLGRATQKEKVQFLKAQGLSDKAIKAAVRAVDAGEGVTIPLAQDNMLAKPKAMDTTAAEKTAAVDIAAEAEKEVKEAREAARLAAEHAAAAELFSMRPNAALAYLSDRRGHAVDRRSGVLECEMATSALRF